MRKTIHANTDEKQRLREQIQEELGDDMLEKVHKAFLVLAEAMVRRAIRKAEAQLETGK